MRISDWSSDVCSSDLAYTGFATDTTTQQKEGQLPVDTPQRVPQRGCEPRLGVPASRGPDRNRTWRGAATPRRDSMTVLDRKWPQTATRHKRFRSEEHTSELQSLMRISYAVFCLKKKKKEYTQTNYTVKRLN